MTTKANHDHIQVREITRVCKVALTEEELLKYGEQLADAQDNVVQLEAELKKFKDENKGRQAAAVGQIVRLSSLIRSKYEHRDTPCDEILDWKNGIIQVIRKDTYEIIDERKMDPAQQKELTLRYESGKKQEPPSNEETEDDPGDEE